MRAIPRLSQRDHRLLAFVAVSVAIVAFAVALRFWLQGESETKRAKWRTVFATEAAPQPTRNKSFDDSYISEEYRSATTVENSPVWVPIVPRERPMYVGQSLDGGVPRVAALNLPRVEQELLDQEYRINRLIEDLASFSMEQK